MRTIHRTMLLFLTLGVFATLAVSARASDWVPFEGDSLTPSEFHRLDAELKNAAFERSHQAQAQVAATPPVDQSNYDVKWYDISIRIDDTLEAVFGKITFLAAATTDGVQEIAVDLQADLLVDSLISESGPLEYTRAGDQVVVKLHRAYDSGQLFSFDFFYGGKPIVDPIYPSVGLVFGTHLRAPAIYSLSEPLFARRWWPCKDRPDDKADSIGIHVEVDTALYCASNGSLDSISAGHGGNSRTFHYTCRYPIAAYLFSLAIAPYRVWEQSYSYDNGDSSMPIVYYVNSDLYARSLIAWTGVPEYLDMFTRAFGPYPFLTEKYGHATVGFPGGGMEHQTVTSLANNVSAFDQITVVHELAHQWWGDEVTCETWHDIWLNEGWATYSEAVYQLDVYGWSAYHAYMTTLAYTGEGTIYRYSDTDFGSIFDADLVYNKAAWVVHMLRGVLGEDRFAAGIAAYRDAFKYGTATTEDFKNVWEEATGVQLDAFINQWIYGRYYPNYVYSYWVERAYSGGYDLFIVVKQTQSSDPQVFEMPVDFYIEYADRPGDTLTFMVDERSELLKVHSPSEITSVELDPGGWILKTAQLSPWSVFMVTADEEMPPATVGQAYFKMMEARGVTGANEFSCINGQLPTGLSIASNGLISGAPTVAGDYAFYIQVYNAGLKASDYRQYHIHVNPTSCCVGRVGDVNGMDGDEPTIGDIATLIDMLFVFGNQPDCMAEADVNQSGGADPTKDDVTIGDIVMLVDYLFITGPGEGTLPNCP